jgi:hypothetical protein
LNINDFLCRYRTDEYGCQHFARDVWLALCGQDLSTRLAGLLAPIGQRRPRLAHWRAFERLAGPADPSLVYMAQHGRDPHLGVFLRGGLLHLADYAPAFVPLESVTIEYSDVRFYR